jgi:DNA-binding MarR family transcriptional regulator
MQDDRVPASLPHALVRAFRLVNRAHNRALKPLGLSAEQAHVLTILWRLGPMTVGKLQGLLALSSPTLTGTIDRLQAQRLVRRVPDPRDRRAFVIEPTENSALRRAVDAVLAKTERECFRALAARERRQLLALLERAASALEGDDRAQRAGATFPA